MNKFKSLSDSSTSESEDDGYKNQSLSSASFNVPVQISNKCSSTSESEDDLGRKMHLSSRPFQSGSFKNKLSNQDDYSQNKKPRTMDIKNEFKAPASYRDIEFSGSESDDRSSSERVIPTENSLSFNTTSTKNPEVSKLYNGAAKRMMEKMGFVDGKGLGKYNQGRTEIVEASKQRGRRGFGLHIKGLEPGDIKWDFSKEQESAVEGVLWMPKCEEDPPPLSELTGWMKKGVVKEEIDDETEFCEPSILKNVLGFKSVFDQLENEEKLKARTRSNPFETIRGGIFLNRAAMKMANMDAAFEFMFTNPKDEMGRSLVAPGELLYFADVCAGPGGFSEYVLWRKKWECKGFGFTLKGKNDFKLDEFFAGPPETFEPFYGVKGVDGDGDIYSPDNLRAFCNFVMTNTDEKGVHFMMADGGFSVETKENIQEILSKRLYLCQFLCALMIVRPGGHFVCKLFDLFTPFSVGLVYLMYRAFELVTIFKPNTSRPANSERYIICKWRKLKTTDICNYLFKVNSLLNEVPEDSDEDIREVVPLDLLKSDENFFNYIYESNNAIGERQILHLAKIKAFAQNTELHDSQQSDYRKQCLELWKVPDKARATITQVEPMVKFKDLVRGEKYSEKEPDLLKADSLTKLKHIFDFKAVICGGFQRDSSCSFFLCMGKCNIYSLESGSNRWKKVDIRLEVPAETLFYGELIHELKGEGKAQKKIMSLHVIDVLYLGGKDVRNQHFEDRMSQAQLLAKAVSKPSKPDYVQLKIKQVFGLDEIKDILNRLSMKLVKGSGGMERLCFDVEDGRHIIPSGMLIFRTVGPQWVTAYSRSHCRQYYFDTKKNESIFERMPKSAANFKLCFDKKIFWSWEKGVSLLDKPLPEHDESLVHGYTFWSFVRDQFKNITGKLPHF